MHSTQMYSTLAITILAFLVLCTGLAGAATVTISGTVLDEKTEQPIAGAKVELTNANAGTGYFIGYTDPAGRFVFNNVRTNLPYDLAVFAEGYCPHEMRRWEVPENQSAIDLKLPLIRGAVIRGTVTQSDGTTPIQNAKVELRYQSGGFRVLQRSQSLFTDAKGTFAFAQLPPNVYDLSVSRGEYLSERLVGVRPQAGEEKKYSIKLYRPASISGFVTLEEDGSPLPNLEIMGRGASQEVGTTDQNGFYSVDRLKPGAYKLQSRPSGFHPYDSTAVIQLQEGWNLDNVNFSLTPLPPAMSVNLLQDVFLPDEDVVFQVRTFRTAQYESTIYRLPVQVFTEEGSDLRSLAEKDDLSPYPVALQWTVEIDPFQPYVWIDRDLKAPEHLSPGAYILRIASPSDGIEARILFFVTELGIITKRGENLTFIYASDLRTSMPVPGTKIFIQSHTKRDRTRDRYGRYMRPDWTAPIERASQDKIAWLGETDEQGILVLEDETPDSSSEVIALSPKNHLAVSPLHKSALIDSQDTKIFAYTDRPIYRPNQTIFYKAVLRENTTERCKIPPEMEAKIELRNPRNEVIYNAIHRTNEWGSVDGSLTLPANAGLGRYNLKVNYGSSESQAYFYLEEYRKPEFKVTIEPDKPFYVNGETLNFSVRAEYYFGAPVVNGHINYRFYESSLVGGSYRRFTNSYSRYLSGGETTTDVEGIARIDFTPRRSSSDRRIILEVQVEEASGRSVSAQESVPVGVGLFYITARPKQYVYGPETPLALEIRTRDHNDKPVSVEVDVEFTQEVWSPVRRRYVRPSRPFAVLKATTDAEGKAEVQWLPDTDMNGRIEILIVGQDEKENRITASARTWRMSYSSGSFDYQYSTLEAILDKSSYQPGEEAVLLINTLYPENPIILTIEARDLLMYRIIWPGGKTTRVKIPVLESYTPNVYIGLMMPRGKRLSNRQYTLSVPIRRGEMNVAVSTDKESYKPGETGIATIKTSLPDGAPVKSEVSLAVVDEAIFALRPDHTPDIHTIFYGKQANWVTTSYSFPLQYYGGADKGARMDIRKDFRDTAFWIADVYTGENGEATVPIQFPDNLTTWRLTSHGHTKNTEVGWTKSTTKVTKELVGRLSLPRFFVEGDELKIPTLIHNLTDRNLPSIQTELEIEGGVKLEEKEEKITQAAAGAVARQLWNLKVDAASPTAVFTFSARGEEDSDALQLQAPVLPAGYRENKLLSQTIDTETATIQLEVDESILLNQSRFTFTLTPSIASIALGAIPYLKSFPYGCSEQTLNGFLPSILLIDKLEKMGVLSLSEEEKERIEKNVQTSLSRLYSLQNWNGGWGWFRQNESSLHLSALVLHGLELTRRIGYPVDKNRIDRGVSYLQQNIYEVRDWDTMAYLLYVLCDLDKPDRQLGEELYTNRNEIESIGLALGCLALKRMNMEKQTAGMKGLLLGRLQNLSENEAAWEVSPERRWQWNGTAVETSAWGLMALAELDGKTPAADKIVRWIVSNRQGHRWRSTRETGLVVMALSKVIEAEANQAPPEDITYRLTANGREFGNGFIATSDFINPLSIDISPELVKHGENEIKLEVNHPGGFYALDASLFHHGVIIDPGKHEYFSMIRVYERAIHTKDYRGRPKILTEGFSASEPQDLGQEILVTLIVEAKRDLPYMIIEDPLPSGCEVIESFLNQAARGWNPYSNVERRDQKMVFFLENVPKGETRIEYLMRTELDGSFKANPNHAWCMYYPQISARSATNRLQVK